MSVRAAHLADLKTEDFFEVGRLADEKQVEGPAPAEVGHNDGVDRHGGEKLLPRRLKFLPPNEKKCQRDPIAISGVRLCASVSECLFPAREYPHFPGIAFFANGVLQIPVKG